MPIRSHHFDRRRILTSFTHDITPETSRYPDHVPTDKPDTTGAGPSRPLFRPAHALPAEAETETETGDLHDCAPTPAAGRAAAAETVGALTGVYAPGELASLREDWPA